VVKHLKLKHVKRAPRSTEGLAEAKAAAKMTSEQWKRLQAGMAEKWTAPEYMNVKRPGYSHTQYRDETYHLITRWSADTKISYRPHAKAPGSKSHVRYEKYSRARTVGEALKLGSFPADWCWDYERGFIRVHGPVRDEPIDMSKVEDESTLTKVDKTIHIWYRRELAKNLGLDYRELIVSKGAMESTIMRAHRLVAQREAKKRLELARSERRRISDDDVLATLQAWGFARNPYRQNVMPEGQTWVLSDTLGLLRDRMGDIHVTTPTKMYPAVANLLVRWLMDRLPQDISEFKFTSLNLNCNYAARRHRDGNNFGPSCIAAFGDFTGGALNCWPTDNGSVKLEKLQQKDATQLQIQGGLAMFNGNSAHSVEEFQGERFSVVYFALGCHANAKREDLDWLSSVGMPVPRPDANPYELLKAPGVDAKGTKSAKAPPALRFWSSTKLVDQGLHAKKELGTIDPERDQGIAEKRRLLKRPASSRA